MVEPEKPRKTAWSRIENAVLTLGAAILVLWAFWPRKSEFELMPASSVDPKDQQ